MGTKSEMIMLSGHLCASLHVGHGKRSRPVLKCRITVFAILKNDVHNTEYVKNQIWASGRFFRLACPTGGSRRGALRALSSHSQVPIPRAQRVADRVHLTTSFPPRRLELATRRSAVRRVTDRATREGFTPGPIYSSFIFHFIYF